MKTLIIVAPSSNSGKTTISLGIIRALKNRNIDVSAFKTGPDFIDTKLMSIASKKNAHNLDIHMMTEEGIRQSMSMNMGEVAIVEGVMGYFDGIYNSFENSSYDISRRLDIPALLVYSPKGEMFSAIPKIKGMVEFQDSKIKGVILNKTSKSMYLLLKEQIERYVGVKVLGYLPKDEDLKLENASLGLDISLDSNQVEEYLNLLGEKIEETINLDEILNLAGEIKLKPYIYPKKRDIKIAIAYDDAFNFYYRENLNLFENICHVEYFSPLKDKELPEADLVYLSGGYVEDHKLELNENIRMRKALKEFADSGGYILGEAGGLTYLLDTIEEVEMVGIIKGNGVRTEKLERFGYVNIELMEDNLLGKKSHILSGQEFHKTKVETDEEEVFHIKKPMSKKNWACGYRYKNTLGYFQHINFLGNKTALGNLLDTLEKNRRDKNVY